MEVEGEEDAAEQELLVVLVGRREVLAQRKRYLQLAPSEERDEHVSGDRGTAALRRPSSLRWSQTCISLLSRISRALKLTAAAKIITQHSARVVEATDYCTCVDIVRSE